MMPKPAVPNGRQLAAALELEVATFAYEVEAFKVQAQLGKDYGWLALLQGQLSKPGPSTPPDPI